MTDYKSIDTYISSFPDVVQTELNKLRKLVHAIVPDITEDMSYKMPSFKLNKKPVVYFAAWKDHISLYPTPNGMEKFKEELQPYATGKGTAQFPIDKPIPYDLIEKIVKFRAGEVKK